jgi:hypothetical protein
MYDADTVEAIRLADAIKPMLADRPSQVQGAALADRVAIFISGHIVAGDEKATALMRGALLFTWLKTVRALVESIDADKREASHGSAVV